MKNTTIKAKSSTFGCINITITQKKMEATGVRADITLNDDLILSLPEMPKKQQEQLAGVWERLHDDLVDVNIAQAVIESTITTAIKTLKKEQNTRIIASLL